MPDAHAFLSPSASSRWLVCTPSASSESTVESRDTVFTREGTLAHAMAELVLKGMLGQDTEEEKMQLDQTIMEEGFDLDEITGFVGEYVTEVWSIYMETKEADPDTTLLVEVQVDVEKYAHDCWGTSDIVIVGNGMVQVIDLKYGKGVKVSAVGNTQMRIYGLGALLAFGGWLYDFRKVRMTIIQPRLYHVSTDTLTVKELEEWAEGVLRPQALLARSGAGERVAGTHCRFCRVAGVCSKLASAAKDRMAASATPEYLTPEEMAESLAFLPVAKNWIAALEAAAMEKMTSGIPIPGYKVVEGRGRTEITDPKGLLGALVREGYRKTDLYREPELKGLTELKKLVGAKHFTEIAADYSTKHPGKPVIAEESDRRQAITGTDLGLAKEYFKDV